MTALIDSIELAFMEARQAALDNGGEVRADTVVEAIEVHCKVSDDAGALEAIVDAAYGEARHVWGMAWTIQTSDVAERICDGIRIYATA